MRIHIPLLLPMLPLAFACAALPACKSEGYYEMAGVVGQDRMTLADTRIDKARETLGAVQTDFADAPTLLGNLLEAKGAGWKSAATRAADTAPRCERALKNLDGATANLESVVASLADLWQRDGGSPLDPDGKKVAKQRADHLRATGFAAVKAMRDTASQLRPAIADLRAVGRFAADHPVDGNADDIRTNARSAAKVCGDAGDLVKEAQKALIALEKDIAAGPAAH